MRATQGSRTTRRGRIYMLVRDRKKLATLMVIRDVSHRTLADAAGYSSHSYISRILRGEVKSLKTEPAARIAQFFGVPVEDLFLPRLASFPVQSVAAPAPRRKIAA